MKSLFLVVIFVLTAHSGGLKDIEFGGYVENSTSVTISEDESISDIALLRLEGSWDYKKYGGIETHIIFSAPLTPLDPFVNIRQNSVMGRVFQEMSDSMLVGMSGLLPAQEIPEDMDSTEYAELLEEQSAAQMELMNELLTYLPYSSLYPNNNFTLDRAIVKLYFKAFDLFIGRQMIAWGTGYAFNPTDIWNLKNPMDPDAPRVGVNALRAEIPFGSLSGLSLVVSPGPDFDHTSGGFRLKTNLAGFDMSLCGMRIMNADRKTYDMFTNEGSELFGESGILPEKVMAGIDFAGQVGEIGVWGEAAVNNPVYPDMEYSDFDSLYVQVSAGGDYTFENGLYTMAEYYYNGLGKDDSDKYNAKDFMNIFAGEMAGFGQHYLMAGVRFTLADRFPINLFVLNNFTDISAMLLPAIGYDFSDNISCELSSQIGVGDHKESEYGSTYSNVTLKITGYF